MTRTRTLAPSVLLALALLAAGTSAARGDDPAGYPDAADVARAQLDAQAKGTAVDRIQAELDRSRTDLDRLSADAGLAVEAYNGARVGARGAALAADAARERADAAGAAVDRAREDLGRVAADAYRQGGSAGLGELRAILDAPTPADALLRTEAVRRVVREREDTVRRGAAAAKNAADARRSADAAARTAREAEENAAERRQAAATAVAAQEARVRDVAARHEALVVELAAARSTSVALERQRQDGLAAEAQRRAEDEARRQAEAAAQAAETPSRLAPGDRPDDGARQKRAAPAKGAAAAIAYAKAQLGKPYVWGGEGPDGFDCSGLVMQAWRRAGVKLTHFAATQYAESHPVAYRDLRPGDLVFWTETPRARDIHHVAMYLGDGKMIHAPRTGDVVKISNLFSMGTPDFYARP
ncbi:C40 family peptidase [Uniformispora flossi]|uniref:C40 family peptidase n=1 Tax=Uniformispora flossi TaxID=3390723 RepID=UPI003C2D8593